MVIISVDDLIILANHMTKMEWLKSKLNNLEFDISDLRKVHYYLEVEFEKKCIVTMSQKS